MGAPGSPGSGKALPSSPTPPQSPPGTLVWPQVESPEEEGRVGAGRSQALPHTDPYSGAPGAASRGL